MHGERLAKEFAGPVHAHLHHLVVAWPTSETGKMNEAAVEL